MAQTTAPRRREDWFDEGYVTEWIEKQKEREPERSRQFARLLAMIPYESGESFRYLNVGAGPGPLDLLILRRYPHAQATLLDGSPKMLQNARQVLGPMADRAEFVQANLATPEWLNTIGGSFGAIVSCIAIHNLREASRVRALYSELYQVAAPGALFVNMDYIRLASPLLRPLAEWATSDPEAGFQAAGGGERLPGTVEEQVIWLREAGFSPADCFFKDFRIALFGGFKGEPHAPARERRGS